MLTLDSCVHGYRGAPAAVHDANGGRHTPNSASDKARTLPPRQLEVASLAAAGLTNKAIARRLDIAEATVKEHLRKVRATLGLARRFELPKVVRPASASKGEGLTLTPRQNEVIALVADGVSGIEIARRLGVNEGTVKAHIKCIRKALGVSTRTAMVAWYVSHAGLEG